MHDTLIALLLLLWGLLMGYALRTWHDEERRSRARQRRHTAALNRLAATPPRTPSFDLAAPKRRTTYTATPSNDLNR
jgi:hypothetical protein